jgi:hypothetical protein
MVNVFYAANTFVQLSIKKISFSIALALVTCISLFAQSAALVTKPQPVLTNGGFENNLTSWSTATSNGSNATFTITNDALHVHSGSQGLIVNVTNTGSVSNSVTLSATAVKLNKKGYYLLRFWALAKRRNALLDVNLKDGNTNNTCHFQIWNRRDTTRDQWQLYQYAFKVTERHTTLQLNFNTATTYYLDDVEIVNDETNPELDIRAQYDWQNNFNETYGWLSGDNNNPVLLPDNRVAWVYNDSFMGPENPHTNVLHSPRMINNLVVVQKGDSLTSRYGGNAQRPLSLFVPDSTGSEFWQSGGVVEDGMLKIILIEITRKGTRFAGHTWIGSLSLPDLAVVSLHRLPARLNSSPNCVMQDGGYDYLYFDSHKSTVVGRAPKGQLDSQTPWEFYTGNGNWGADFTQAAILVAGMPAGNVIKIGPGNYAMSGIPNLSGQVAVWFAQSPVGPWVNKTIIYHVPAEEGLLAYEGHVDPLGNKGVYTFTYSLYPFVQNPVAMQLADKTTYVPGFVKANLLKLSPFTGKAHN